MRLFRRYKFEVTSKSNAFSDKDHLQYLLHHFMSRTSGGSAWCEKADICHRINMWLDNNVDKNNYKFKGFKRKVFYAEDATPITNWWGHPFSSFPIKFRNNKDRNLFLLAFGDLYNVVQDS